MLGISSDLSDEGAGAISAMWGEQIPSTHSHRILGRWLPPWMREHSRRKPASPTLVKRWISLINARSRWMGALLPFSTETVS